MSMRWRAYGVVVGGVLVHLTLGTIYTFGNMTPYITSYMRKHKVYSTLNYAESTWINSIAAMGQGMSMFLGGILNRRIGPRWTTLLGGWIASLGVLMTYFTVKMSFALTVMTYGLLFGLGVGVAYAVPMDCAMKWLPDKKGLINGIVVAGFGSGAFIFDQIQTAYLNPDNHKTDTTVDTSKYFSQDVVLNKVPSCFLLLGGCYAAIQFIGSMLLVNPPPKRKDNLQTSTKNTTKDDTEPLIDKISCEGNDEDDEDDGSFTPRQAVRRKEFYLLWFMFFFNSQGIQFISSLYKAYGQTFIGNDRFLAIVGSFAAVFNGLGRIMWGHLADRFCFKTAMVFSCGLFSALILSFGLTSLAGEGLFFIYVCLLFLCFSGNFSLLPTATAKTFGKKYYPVIYGIVFTASVPTSPISALLTSNLKVVIGWYGMFYLVASFSFISMILAWVFSAKGSNGLDV